MISARLKKNPDPDPTENMPNVYLMPAILKYDNYIGTANTWEEYGKWVRDLYKGRNELSETEKIKIKALLKKHT